MIILSLSLSTQCSDTTGLWSVSLVILGSVSWSLLQGRRSTPHTLHPLAAGQRWHPLPWAGGAGWMCTTQLHEAPVTHRVHMLAQILPVFNTGTFLLLLLDWEMLLRLFDNVKDCFRYKVWDELHCRWRPSVLEWILLLVYFNSFKWELKPDCD